MSTTASLAIRRRKNDDLFMVIIRVVHNRQNSSIATGILCDEKSWDNNKSQIKSSCKLYANITQVNSILSDKMKKTMDKILEIEKKGALHSMSLLSLMKILNPRKANITVIGALSTRYENLMASEQTSLANTCKSAISLIKGSLDKDVTFEELTSSKLEAMKLVYRQKNNKGSGNGIKPYLTQIKMAYKDALREHTISDNDELTAFQVSWVKPVKRAVSINYIKSIIDLKCKPGTIKYHCRNILIFMYLQGGINMVDLLHLKSSNIVDNRLRYIRHKTQKLYDQPLALRSKEILNEYLHGKSDNDYIFPILEKHFENKKDADKYYHSRYVTVNYNINKIGREIGAPIKLTSYVTRHSFASHARDANVSMAAIQGGLGHASARTTEVYLSEINVNISDQAFTTIEQNLG